MIKTEIRLIVFFGAEDGEALYRLLYQLLYQQKQDTELTMAQITSSLLQNSSLNWRKQGKILDRSIWPKSNPLWLYSRGDEQIQGIRSGRQSAWRTMDRGWWCIGSSDHPPEKEMQKSKMAVWGGLTNGYEKKRSEKQRRKGKIYPFECRVPKNSKEAFLSLLAILWNSAFRWVYLFFSPLPFASFLSYL